LFDGGYAGFAYHFDAYNDALETGDSTIYLEWSTGDMLMVTAYQTYALVGTESTESSYSTFNMLCLALIGTAVLAGIKKTMTKREMKKASTSDDFVDTTMAV